MRNQITTIAGAIFLAEMGVENGSTYLAEFGLKTINEAKHKLSVLTTKYNLLAVKDKDTGIAPNYNIYKDVVILEHILKRNINLETATVSYWIELTKLTKTIQKNG